MKEAIASDPAYQYRSAKEVHKEKEDGARDGYFNEAPEDSFKLAEAAVARHNVIKAAQKAIKPSEAHPDFFENLYAPIDLPSCYHDGGHDASEKCKHPPSTIHKEILRILLALQDIGRETEPGTLEQSMKKGLIHDYGMHELLLGYEVYKDLIACDLRDGAISQDILRFARDPPSALVNVVERMQALDLKSPEASAGVEDLSEQVRQLMEESGKDPIDKETMKQIAIHLALQREDADMVGRARTNRA